MKQQSIMNKTETFKHSLQMKKYYEKETLKLKRETAYLEYVKRKINVNQLFHKASNVIEYVGLELSLMKRLYIRRKFPCFPSLEISKTDIFYNSQYFFRVFF